MIIDAKTIIVTLIIVAAASVYALKLIRRFALEIAQQNHDAVKAMDEEEEQQRLKKERAANAAADAAFAQVEPMLKISVVDKPKAAPVPAQESSSGDGAI